MAADLGIWSPVITGASTLTGVVLTFLFTSRNSKIAREHERRIRHEERHHALLTSERQRRREVYESFLASIDALERAASLLHSGRLSGRAVDNDPTITTAVLNSTAQHYEARSLLILYGPDAVVSAGVTASAHVLQIDAAYQNVDRWKADLYRFKDRYAAAVKADLESMLQLSLTDPGAERISG